MTELIKVYGDITHANISLGIFMAQIFSLLAPLSVMPLIYQTITPRPETKTDKKVLIGIILFWYGFFQFWNFGLYIYPLKWTGMIL
jgi:hypothetical protein